MYVSGSRDIDRFPMNTPVRLELRIDQLPQTHPLWIASEDECGLILALPVSVNTRTPTKSGRWRLRRVLPGMFRMPLRNFHLHAQAPDQPLSGTSSPSVSPKSASPTVVEPLSYRYLRWIQAKFTGRPEVSVLLRALPMSLGPVVLQLLIVWLGQALCVLPVQTPQPSQLHFVSATD